ncbi:MAG: hypothetical protein J0L77_02940 [Alphaproteobacteria bacterium]|nr:hypothetical protein [Alphaproteobacteria bacterium]
MVYYLVFPASTHETNFGLSRREEFWFIEATRSEDETEPKDRASELRAGQSTGRTSAEGHPASAVFG